MLEASERYLTVIGQLGHDDPK